MRVLMLSSLRRRSKNRALEVAEKVEDFTEGGFCYAFCGSKTLKDFANVVCRAFWRVVVLEQFLTAHKVRLFQHLLQPLGYALFITGIVLVEKKACPRG